MLCRPLSRPVKTCHYRCSDSSFQRCSHWQRFLISEIGKWCVKNFDYGAWLLGQDDYSRLLSHFPSTNSYSFLFAFSIFSYWFVSRLPLSPLFFFSFPHFLPTSPTPFSPFLPTSSTPFLPFLPTSPTPFPSLSSDPLYPFPFHLLLLGIQSRCSREIRREIDVTRSRTADKTRFQVTV